MDETWVGVCVCVGGGYFRVSLRKRCLRVWVNGGVPKTPGVVLGAKLFLLFWGVMGKVLGFLRFLITLLMITYESRSRYFNSVEVLKFFSFIVRHCTGIFIGRS